MRQTLFIWCLSLALGISLYATPSEQLELLLSPQKINKKVQRVGKELNARYAGKEVTLIMVMKGAVCIAADLMRELKVPVTVEYIKASSYGARGATPGELSIIGLENLKIEGKEVLLVDDIFDTGNTLTGLVARLKEKNPKSLTTLVLLRKKMQRTGTVVPDYVLFDIENLFVVGYGLDYKERHRHLPGVYVLK